MRVRRRTVTMSVTEAIDREIDKRSERSTDLPTNRKSERAMNLPTKEPMEQMIETEANLPTNRNTDHLTTVGHNRTEGVLTGGGCSDNICPSLQLQNPQKSAKEAATVPLQAAAVKIPAGYPVTAEETRPLSPWQFMQCVPSEIPIADTLTCWKALLDSLGAETTASMPSPKLQSAFMRRLLKLRADYAVPVHH